VICTFTECILESGVLAESFSSFLLTLSERIHQTFSQWKWQYFTKLYFLLLLLTYFLLCTYNIPIIPGRYLLLGGICSTEKAAYPKKSCLCENDLPFPICFLSLPDSSFFAKNYIRKLLFIYYQPP
jgi:hypothetical protein